MSKLPKFKIKYPFGNLGEEICDLEQAKQRFTYGGEIIVVVEGQVVNSYEQLAQLATQDAYKDREFLEVVLVQNIGGG